MNLGWTHLAGTLLQGTDLKNASAEEINILLEEYPYFAGLHLLKVVKLSQMGSEELPMAMSRAALYFPNPHWFRLGMEKLQKDHDGSETMVSAPTVDDAPIEMSLESAFTTEVTAEPETSAEHPEMAETAEETMPEPAEPSVNWEHHLAENPVFQQHVVSDEEHYEQEVWHHQGDTKEEEPTVAEVMQPEHPGAIAEHAEPAREMPHEPLEAPALEEASENLQHAPLEEPAFQKPPIEEPALEMPVSETTEQEMAVSGPGEDETSTQPEQAPAMAGPGLDIPFEPLYTIDYFASQGIKVNQEAPTKDQLALKLRSFTEWLRAMKKIHPEKMAKDFNQDEEDHVRVNAEVSNEAHEVYTEAMAEVFLKQGKKEKAREVFEKLSLLDPSKSAYFAVRIKEIN